MSPLRSCPPTRPEHHTPLGLTHHYVSSLEKAMVTHSSILAWEMAWTEEPGGLQSMGLQSRTQLSN